MKIIKYTKLKNNKYRVDFETESLELYDDIILKYELLLKKSIRDEELLELKKENLSFNGYSLALKYLNSKMRTKKEMQTYLEKKEIPKNLIQDTIFKLESLGYLNDMQYVHFYLSDHIKFSKDGPYKIKQKLKELGIEENIIENAIKEISFDVWKDKMEKLVSKKLLSNRSYSEQVLKNKIITYLFICGYPKEWSQNFVETFSIPKDPSILLKEKEKIICKLSRKYKGESLNYQVRMKLYQRGFSKEEIDEVI